MHQARPVVANAGLFHRDGAARSSDDGRRDDDTAAKEYSPPPPSNDADMHCDRSKAWLLEKYNEHQPENDRCNNGNRRGV